MKKKIRSLYKNIRKYLSQCEKTDFDTRIFTTFINSDVYKSAEQIIIYVSVGKEVDTLNIIEYSLNNNKRVAIPVCIDKNMYFYEIHSLSELMPGRFGIPAVDIHISTEITDFEKAVCVVPGICFDSFGNRIGYGGGYYDRFLSVHSVKTVGLCYERCICSKLPEEKFDKQVNYILSEKGLRNSKYEEVSTYE